MPRYEVSVEVVRAYVVVVEADSPQAAAARVEDMELSDVEADDNYVDTHRVVDDEPELSDDDGDDSAGATEPGRTND